MEKVVGIKLEGKEPYNYYHSSYSVEEILQKMASELKEGQAIVIKCGNEHHYIDWDEDNFHHYRVNEVMYYVRNRLGRF